MQTRSEPCRENDEMVIIWLQSSESNGDRSSMQGEHHLIGHEHLRAVKVCVSISSQPTVIDRFAMLTALGVRPFSFKVFFISAGVNVLLSPTTDPLAPCTLLIRGKYQNTHRGNVVDSLTDSALYWRFSLAMNSATRVKARLPLRQPKTPVRLRVLCTTHDYQTGKL